MLDFNQIWQESFLGEGDLKLFIWSTLPHIWPQWQVPQSALMVKNSCFFFYLLFYTNLWNSNKTSAESILWGRGRGSKVVHMECLAPHGGSRGKRILIGSLKLSYFLLYHLTLFFNKSVRICLDFQYYTLTLSIIQKIKSTFTVCSIFLLWHVMHFLPYKQ